jgi:hypothetical protein
MASELTPRVKRGFDNHIEGSSIEHYLSVVETIATYGITRGGDRDDTIRGD